jgi:hypothetical protein
MDSSDSNGLVHGNDKWTPPYVLSITQVCVIVENGKVALAIAVRGMKDPVIHNFVKGDMFKILPGQMFSLYLPHGCTVMMRFVVIDDQKKAEAVVDGSEAFAQWLDSLSQEYIWSGLVRKYKYQVPR